MTDDATPFCDRCSKCGREGRSFGNETLTGATTAVSRVLPLDGLELEIATHVGATTIAAGELDAAMSALCSIAGTDTLDAITATWGRSGTDLTAELRRLRTSSELDQGRVQELGEICDKYDSLYSVRNDVIHSFRPGHGTERLDAIRAVKSTKRNPFTIDGAFRKRRLGINELVVLYYDLTDLTYEVRNFYFSVIGIIDEG